MYRDVWPLQRNLLAFTAEGVKEWAENMKNYNEYDGSREGFIAYRMQPMERDAEEYSLRNTQIYLMEIDDALKNKVCEE